MLVNEILNKVVESKASAICQDIELDQQALSYLNPEVNTVDFLNTLIDLKLYPDAVKFLARALPKREAVWWACISARSAISENADPLVLQALLAAEQWVYQQHEDLRRQANTAAYAAIFAHPASWAAMAAFWSQGSMVAADLPAVPPADNLTAKAVAGAVMLSAVAKQADKINDRYIFFLKQGIEIGKGGNGQILQD